LSVLSDEESEKKVNRERLEACLNCESPLTCDNISKFEFRHCVDFVKDEEEASAWLIEKLYLFFS
jgi:hypothetical protein